MQKQEHIKIRRLAWRIEATAVADLAYMGISNLDLNKPGDVHFRIKAISAVAKKTSKLLSRRISW